MNGNDVEIKKPRIKIPQPVIVRAPGLLPMLYKLRELAEDLGVPYRTLWDWTKFGLPHQIDARGHIWINGEDFKQWVTSNRKKPRVRLADWRSPLYALRAGEAAGPRGDPGSGEAVPSAGKMPELRQRREPGRLL